MSSCDWLECKPEFNVSRIYIVLVEIFLCGKQKRKKVHQQNVIYYSNKLTKVNLSLWIASTKCARTKSFFSAKM